MSKIQQMGNGAVHSIIFSPTGGPKKVVSVYGKRAYDNTLTELQATV